jgi:hypothetical protein
MNLDSSIVGSDDTKSIQRCNSSSPLNGYGLSTHTKPNTLACKFTLQDRKPQTKPFSPELGSKNLKA